MASETREPAVPETGALVYWFDIAPEVRAEWLHWYLTDHMPSRVGTVFTSGRCYEAVDFERASASHMVLFETTHPEALLEPSYLALLGQVSDADRARRGWYANVVRGTMRVRSRHAQGSGGVGGVLGALHVDSSACGLPRVHLAACLAGAVVPALAAVPCIGAAWMLEHDAGIRQRLDAARVTGQGDASADLVVLMEAGHAADVAAAAARLDALPAWRELRLAPGAWRLDAYRLLYSMAQPGR
jgi:hypothetical protein